VLLLDRAGRIKPCGGAIPPEGDPEFDIPDEQLEGQDQLRAMVAPSDRHVDMPIDGGYVGMVDREPFDEWLRERAAANRRRAAHGSFETLTRDSDGTAIVHYKARHGGRPHTIGRCAPAP
jgi:geranylgeranyl reductase